MQFFNRCHPGFKPVPLPCIIQRITVHRYFAATEYVVNHPPKLFHQLRRINIFQTLALEERRPVARFTNQKCQIRHRLNKTTQPLFIDSNFVLAVLLLGQDRSEKQRGTGKNTDKQPQIAGGLRYGIGRVGPDDIPQFPHRHHRNDEDARRRTALAKANRGPGHQRKHR